MTNSKEGILVSFPKDIEQASIVGSIYFQRLSNEKLDFKASVERKAGAHGDNLFVGGKTVVTRNTWLGNNVNFNGMTISGRGKVTIGDNFHSGPECIFITSIHNYDHGEAIPYDLTHIKKKIVIGENVWLGSMKIFLLYIDKCSVLGL